MGRILQVLLCAGRAGNIPAGSAVQKNGESAWFKPYGYDQNSNDGEWMYEVRPATDMPALRMITLENQKCNTFLAYPVPDNDWFNIVYTLSNKSRKAMKGTVKVVWEREFKLESNSYRPSAKRRTRLMTMNGAMNWEAALLT